MIHDHQMVIERKFTEMKILIVDDSKNGALALQMQLIGNGYDRVDTVSSAQEAFDYLNSQPSDDPCILILMDICMPEMDGIEATRWLKKQPKFCDIPVVMVSGEDDIERLSQAFNAGALDFIRKTAEETELIARVESVLRLQREMEHRIAHEKELKLLTEQFKKKAHEAEMANRSKSQFLANMSHEIRTPMNGIIGMASLALAKNKSPLVATYLKSVQNSAQVLLNLLNDILDLSSIDSEKMNMEHLEFNIRETVEQSVTLFAKKAYEKEIELILNFDNAIPEKAIGDPFRLTQILNNLISNAIKFTSDGAITVSVLFFKQHEKNLQLKFIVKDTGVGIDPSNHNKVFAIFTQADSSTTRQYGGTGLGLTICKKLVERMNGDIQIESQLGEGSTFTFTAQFLLPDKQPEKKNWFPDDTFSNLKAIVFDNSLIAAKAAVACLVSIGVKATHTQDPKKLIQHLKNQNNVDFILINNFLEETDGLTFAQEIRTNLTLFQPKIIIMCGLGIEVSDNLLQRSGVDSLVNRPLTCQNLANSIIKAIDPKLLDETIADQSADIYQYDNIHALLVEDNEVNIEVTLGILKMANINKVDIAVNGLEAIEKIKKAYHANQIYDFVLMDVQMPEMDGLEATQAIRTFETSFLSKTKQTTHRLPVIAMTANAMNGDKEICIGAGMNDYITKPLVLDSLIEKIDQWVFSKRISNKQIITPGVTAEKKNHIDDLDVLDMDSAIKRLSGQKKLYLNLLKRYYEEHEHTDLKIKASLEKQDYKSAHLMSHTIKGLASSLSAKSLKNSAQALEKAISSRDHESISILFDSFQVEARRILEKIDTLLNLEKNKELPEPENTSKVKNVQPEKAQKEKEHSQPNKPVIKISEIDEQTALNRLAGNVDLFIKVLKKFYQDYQDFTVRIREAFLKKNLARLKQEAHTLKGVASYLAADSLLDAAKKLEIYATEKRYEQIQAVIFTIEDIIARIFSGIRGLIQNENFEDVPDQFMQIPNNIKNKFSVLHKLLTESDSEIKDMIQDFEDALNQVSISLSARRYLKKMVREINSYQFDNAKMSLLSLADSFNIKIVENEVAQ